MSKFFTLLVVYGALPAVLFAADAPTSFKSLVDLIIGLINNLIYLIFALTLLVFIWGVVRAWIFNGGDAKKVEEGRRFVFIAIITLTVMTSLWGIIRILQNTLFGGGA